MRSRPQRPRQPANTHGLVDSQAPITKRLTRPSVLLKPDVTIDSPAEAGRYD